MDASAFRLLDLPIELQQQILGHCLERSDVPLTALLASCRTIHDIFAPLMYASVHLRSIDQAKQFIDTARVYTSGRQDPRQHTRRFTFTLVGVPGGSTRGGRESAPPGSPGKDDKDGDRAWTRERLWVASTAISLCPAVEHIELEMFGVRHSTLLTSSNFLSEVANAFRQALSALPTLKSFAWITPRINHNFIGFSVAVVDLAFSPLIEGLQAAAVHMTPDQRRVRHDKGSTNRRAHSLQSITLHHCIFPLSAYANESLFFLLAQTHPDDDDWLLFPAVDSIIVRTAINVDLRSVAYLLLTWQLHIDPSMKASLSCVERHQVEQNPAWNPRIRLTNTYINSIWGPPVSSEGIRDHVQTLLDECKSPKETDGRDACEPSDNPYIRALEECADTQTRLTDGWAARVRGLREDQLAAIVDRACARVHVEAFANAIAGSKMYF